MTSRDVLVQPRTLHEEVPSGESDESSDSDGEAPSVKLSWGAIALGAVAVLAICVASFSFGASTVSEKMSSDTVAASLRGQGTGTGGTHAGWRADTDAMDQETERGTCAQRDHSFRWISTYDPMAAEAVRHTFSLINAARRTCPHGKMPALPFDKDSFLHGDTSRQHVHVHHKFSPSCDSETFRMRFHFAGAGANETNSNTTFIVELNRNRQSKVWRLLSSTPTACDIGMGIKVQAHSLAKTSEATEHAARFAAKELASAMQRNNCLPNGTESFRVSRVLRSVAIIVDGLFLQMTIELVDQNDQNPRQASLAVLETCADEAGCVRHLTIPYGDVCSVFTPDSETAATHRLLSEASPGAEASDPTEIFDAQRQFLLQPRRLQEERKPITVRHLTQGDVPDEFDPRGHHCLQQVKVYNQGHCASCYAHASSQMIGIRKCLLENGGSKGAGSIAVIPRPLEDLLEAECADDAKWTAETKDKGTLNCAWFASNDPGCDKMTDVGQKSHCLMTCNTCKKVDRLNPWLGANYNYMPSPADVAQCSRDVDGEVRGCQGGSPAEVWNNWMKNLDRPLWSINPNCLPDKLKCEYSTGKTMNPLVKGKDCALFSNYDLWHRPCNCIPDSEKPKKMQCPAQAPPPECAHKVPTAFFELRSVAHGLAVQEAVLNMQRHILEGGPIFVSAEQTKEFMHWDFEQKPVYTGGPTILGAHAMLAVGWGNLAGTDFWWIRNSWGAWWAEQGYCRFQRGVNLDGIEEIGIDASMPHDEADIHDAAAPICEFSYMRWQWWIMGDGTVSNYTGFVDIKCDEDATLKVHFSNIVEHHDDPASGGVDRSLSATAHGTATFPINLLRLGFGTKRGDMHIDIQAEDSTGNIGKTTAVMNIPPAGS